MKTLQKKENPRKAELVALSLEMRKKRRAGIDNAASPDELMYWESLGINDMILELYQEQAGTDDFRTFLDWLSSGYSVKKGEKGWVIWQRKRKAEKTEQNEKGEEVKDEFEFWALCYLFSIHQVEPVNPDRHEEE